MTDSALGLRGGDAAPEIDPTPFVTHEADGSDALVLLVDGIHCAGCVQRIEKNLSALPGVRAARVNLTTKRLRLAWDGMATNAAALVGALDRLGYESVPFAAETLSPDHDREGRRLLRCLAVAGFGAMNVMLLSAAVWAGAFSDMDGPTRDLFHWVSALIVMPTVAYAVRPFFSSAVAGLKNGEMRMDLPITVAVLLTTAMSLFETVRGGEHAYFDAAASLLFFLLVGRYLDRQARAKACAVAENLLVLQGATATLLEVDGSQRPLKVAAIEPGMTLLVPAGARLPADGEIARGRSDIDASLLTGESMPEAVRPRDKVFAGTFNRTAPLVVKVTAAGANTLLAEIVRLMDVAGQSRARYVRLADRIARVYSPVVHLAALATFLGWIALAGAPWQQSLMVAVAVLIITCPCALGLAVPVVQVVASGRLLRRGVLLKSPDGLERLAAIDTVLFDKTGTLTLGRLKLANLHGLADADLALAASLAAGSRHPLCQALTRLRPKIAPLDGVVERPGLGLAATTADGELRLGSRLWCGATDAPGDHDGPELWLRRADGTFARFLFDDMLRPDAADTIAALKARGLAVELLSGDRAPAVAQAARAAGIADWHAAYAPGDKIARLRELAALGRKVLMVGDGLNDAPALASAYVSMSPATGADVSQAAADYVFQGEGLDSVREAYDVARRSQRLVAQNIAAAFVYNALAVPLAVLGFVTPLIAAIAMSSSSIIVTLNSLRLYRAERERRRKP
ncbi:MAG: heavy metal translocating P-type ATPase [Alphaproteobacteria bacterium]